MPKPIQRRSRVPAAIYAPNWAWPATLTLAVLGLGLSAYLSYVHYTDPKSLSCPQNSVENCLKVTTSNQSEIFGHIPVAVTGAGFYVVVLILMLPWVWRLTNPWIAWARLAAVVSGVGMVGYLVFVEAAQLHAICLYCTGVHILTVLLFLVVLAAYLLRPLDAE